MKKNFSEFCGLSFFIVASQLALAQEVCPAGEVFHVVRYEREAMFIGRERGKLFRVSCSDLTLDPSGNESGVAQRCTETDIRQLFVNLTLARCLPPAPEKAPATDTGSAN